MAWVHRRSARPRPFAGHADHSLHGPLTLDSLRHLWVDHALHHDQLARYREVVPLVAWLHVAFGAAMLAVDRDAGMPWWWVAAEGPPLAMIGSGDARAVLESGPTSAMTERLRPTSRRGRRELAEICPPARGRFRSLSIIRMNTFAPSRPAPSEAAQPRPCQQRQSPCGERRQPPPDRPNRTSAGRP